MKHGADAPWLEGVETVVCTKGGKQIMWQCFIGNHHETTTWADFMDYETLLLEAAFVEGKKRLN